MATEISKSELQRILRMFFADAKTEHERDYAFKSFLFYLKRNANKLADDAVDFISGIGDIFIKHLEQSVETMPDGEKKRNVKRQIALARGEHYSYENLTRQLYQEPKKELDINLLTEKIFIKLGQKILDLLYDIPKKNIKKADYVVLTLFHSAIDEILVAFHLAQHGYSSQSFHHSRTVLEIIDLAELFEKQPDEVKIWSDDDIDQKKKWEEFSPSKVRKKLNKNSFDPTYSFMSEIGTHITSYYTKPKVEEVIHIGKELKKKVNIRLGGSYQKWAVISANTACIHATMMLINRLTGNFKQYLNEDEVINFLVEITEDYKKYCLDGFVKYSKEKGKDVDKVENFIKNIKITP